MSEEQARADTPREGLDARTYGYALASVGASVAAHTALDAGGGDVVLEATLGVGLVATFCTLAWAGIAGGQAHVGAVRVALAAWTWTALMAGLNAGGAAPPGAALAGAAAVLAALAVAGLAASRDSTGDVRARQRAGAAVALWCAGGLIAVLCAGNALAQAAVLALGAVVFGWTAHLPFEDAQEEMPRDG